MDVGDKENSDSEKRNEESAGGYTPRLPSDCRFRGGNFVNSSMGMVNPASLSSMADSYGAVVWENPGNSQPYSGVNQIGLAGGAPGALRIRPDAGWQDPNSVAKGGFLLPTGSGGIPQLSQLPADSAFIERAARFSCFNSGNIADLMNSFPINQAVSPYHQLSSMPSGSIEGLMGAATRAACGGEPLKNETNPPSTSKDEVNPQVKITRRRADAKQTESDEAESVGGRGKDDASLMDTSTEPSLAKGFDPKKRKKASQETEPEQSQQISGEDANDTGKHSSPPPTIKTTGKNGKPNPQGSDPSKEEYIHIRARRGQATNSHSLAERIRREKISERMKFLQDLVPGCSKVTGKAVMLDEIINYVQSLQRQVEFLSMKLATVDPRVDFNIDNLLAKEHMFSAVAGPSSLGFSPDMPMAYHPMHPQPSSIHHNLPIIGNSSDALRNLNPQLTSINEGYKESTQQIPNVWDYELQNVVQMGFDPSAPAENQETNSSLPPAHMKVEP